MSQASETNTVFAIGAHPGDATLLCGGTLALLRAAGWNVAIASMTLRASTSGKSSDQTGERGGLERSRAAAAELGADYYCVGVEDFVTADAVETCRYVTGLIRIVQPALVLTHGPWDSQPDAAETSGYVQDACRRSPDRDFHVNVYLGAEPPTERVPHLFYFGELAPTGDASATLAAELVIDVASTVDTKLQALVRFGEGACGARSREGTISSERFWQEVAEGFPGGDLLRAALAS